MAPELERGQEVLIKISLMLGGNRYLIKNELPCARARDAEIKRSRKTFRRLRIPRDRLSLFVNLISLQSSWSRMII